tara:strand:- start:755 stop:883 length:129 start_codon:yes stop_codon:yes gene_type:complete
VPKDAITVPAKNAEAIEKKTIKKAILVSNVFFIGFFIFRIRA